MPRIALETLQEWITPERRPLPLEEASAIVAQFFCARLAVDGLCPHSAQDGCRLCQPSVGRMFNLSRARNPSAYLTVLAKEQAAVARDCWHQAKTAHSRPTIPTPERASPEADNPFRLLGELL
ncbi:MAG TPA: hypothetical protein VFF68_01035 [Anaerolineaceae bacterium]|nr:hypothetical protein [Anaerolineaceae bacterium]